MRTITKVAVATAGASALLVSVGWLGLKIAPKPFPPHSEGTGELYMAEPSSDLPEPVQRYLRATLGEGVPQIETSVVWGRGYFNLNGLLWFPMRFRAYNVAGQEFHRDMELTWFGMPIFRGYDAYRNGKGSLEFAGLLGIVHVSDSGEKVDQSDNFVMWTEVPFTTPSALALDPRVHWEPIDDNSARLIFPFGDQEDSLRVEFEVESGLITRMSGMRYRDQEETKTPYRGEYSEWRTVHGIKIPHRPVATWEDQEEPYVILDIEGAEYNVDVSDKIP
jgi:uncharacterized protein DUF6544